MGNVVNESNLTTRINFATVEVILESGAYFKKSLLLSCDFRLKGSREQKRILKLHKVLSRNWQGNVSDYKCRSALPVLN